MLGGKCTQQLISEPLGENDTSFRQDALNFLVELAVQIRNRFDMRALSSMNCVNPVIALRASDVRPVSLIPLAMKLPAVLSDKDADRLDDQWGQLPLHEESLKVAIHPANISECHPELFWNAINNLKDATGTFMFPKLGQFMCDVLLLPHSSAAV